MLTLGDLEGPDRVRGSVGLGVVSCTSQPFCGMKSWGKTVSESGVARAAFPGWRQYASKVDRLSVGRIVGL